MTNHSNRENLVSGYDCTSRNDLNACAELLAEITQLEHELGHLPKGWQHHWQGILKYYPNIFRHSVKLIDNFVLIWTF